ncbi:MAG: DUF4215 domain-containing protein, partial [Pseudomonadota bacterium]
GEGCRAAISMVAPALAALTVVDRAMAPSARAPRASYTFFGGIAVIVRLAACALALGAIALSTTVSAASAGATIEIAARQPSPALSRDEAARLRQWLAAVPALRGDACGDGLPDPGEQCDDGNAESGDGCSDACQIEAGFSCTAALPPFANNVADPGFESGGTSADWTQNSTVFDPICSGLTCLGDGSTSLAFEGDYWAWFGGVDIAHVQTLTQTLTVPADAPTLTFELAIGICDSADDALALSVDGTEVYRRSCDAVTAGYETQTVDLSDPALGGPYNDDAAHTLEFAGTTVATNGGNSNLFVDVVEVNSPAPPSPSVCTAVPCGDALLDPGEQCDDGNTNDGDGCSAACQIEAGFACTLPEPPVANGDIVADGGFELPGQNALETHPFWTESGSVFTPICDAAACGAFLGNEGQGFAWFGGTDVPHTQSLEQSVTIPVSVTALDVGLLIAGGGVDGACDGPDDTLRILIDGNVVFQSSSPCTASEGGIGAYPIVSVNLTAGAYNDGGVHMLRIEGETFAANGTNTNFLLDSLTAPFVLDPPLPPVPSQCSALPETCYIEDFDDAGAGSLAGWTRFNDGAQNSDWGTTDDGLCGSNNVGAGNFSGGAGQAACIDSDALGSPAVNAYLCSPPLALEGSGHTLDFLYSYHPFQASGADDAFEVLIGTEAPSLATIGGYASTFLTNAGQGTLIGLPGATASLDIGAFTGSTVHACFRYGADFDWYAHVDDVAVRAATCTAAPDSDGDGIADAVDNCTLVANPLQIDSNGDGIGNVCDADIAGPTGPGGDDCAVAFFDLAQMKNVFFSADPDADLVGEGGTEPDGEVNFFDLGRMKELFFGPPGPSATGCN